MMMAYFSVTISDQMVKLLYQIKYEI